MDEPLSTARIVRFAVTVLGVFALIFLGAVVTPWLARKVDAWIARYREHHDPHKSPDYGVRSIYELPPKQEETDNDQKGTEPNGKE